MTGAQAALYREFEATLIPEAKAVGFQIQTGDGALIGPGNALLYSPEIGESLLRFQESEQCYSALDARTRQVVILTVAAIWRADYVIYSHEPQARSAGLTDHAIVALLDGGDTPQDLDDTDQLAAAITRSLIVKRSVDPDLYTAASSAITPKGIVDLVALAAAYECLCALSQAFSIPAPAQAH